MPHQRGTILEQDHNTNKSLAKAKPLLGNSKSYDNTKDNTILTKEFVSFKGKLDKIIQAEEKLLSESPKLRIKLTVNSSHPIKKPKLPVKSIVDSLKFPKNLKQYIKIEQLEIKNKTAKKIQALGIEKKQCIFCRKISKL